MNVGDCCACGEMAEHYMYIDFKCYRAISDEIHRLKEENRALWSCQYGTVPGYDRPEGMEVKNNG
jgi:hypothetical protein